ncbi:MAG: hypothetical protein ACFHU9_10770 [Fluviicola sp.]
MIILNQKVIVTLYCCFLACSLLGQEDFYISTDWNQSGRLFEEKDTYSKATSWKTDPVEFVGQVGDEYVYYATHYNNGKEVDVNILSATISFFDPKSSSTRQVSQISYPSRDEVKCLALLEIDDSLLMLVANMTKEQAELWSVSENGHLIEIREVADVKVKPTAYANFMKVNGDSDTYYIELAPKLYYTKNYLLTVSQSKFILNKNDKMQRVTKSGGTGTFDVRYDRVTHSNGGIYYLDVKVGKNLKKCHIYKFDVELESFIFLKEFMLEDDYSDYNSFQLFANDDELLVAACKRGRSYEKDGIMATESNWLYVNKIELYNMELESGIEKTEAWFVPTYPILDDYVTPQLISRNGKPYLIANVDRSYLDMAREKPEYYELKFENMVVCEYPINDAIIGTGNTVFKFEENDAILTGGIYQISDYLLMVPKLNKEKIWINFSILNPVFYE